MRRFDRMDDITYTALGIAYNLKRFEAKEIIRQTILARSLIEADLIDDLVRSMMLRNYFQVDEPTVFLKLNPTIESIYLEEKRKRGIQSERDNVQHELNLSLKKTNYWQIVLACVIAAATVAQVLVAIYNSTNDKSSFELQETQLKEQKKIVKKLEEKLSNKEISDSVLFRRIQDSLRIP